MLHPAAQDGFDQGEADMTGMGMRARRAGATALAALVAACGGGGGGGSDTPEVPDVTLVASEYNEPTGTGASTAARYGSIEAVTFSQLDNALAPTVAAGAGLLTLTGAIPAGNTFGGVLAVVVPPTSTFDPRTRLGHVAVQDYSAQSRLHVVAGSPSVQRLLVELVPQGGPFNGCVPAAEVSVGSAAAEHVLELDAAVWQVPARCTAAERALTLADALKHLQVINVGFTENQVAGLADGAARSFTLGRISFSGVTPAPIDFDEVVTLFNRPDGVGDSLAALHGGLGLALFSEQGNATAGAVLADRGMVNVATAVPAGNIFGGLLLEVFGPGSTWVPSRSNTAVGTGDVVFGSFGDQLRLRVQVGSATAERVAVRLVPRNGPFDHCAPTFLLAVDARTVSRDISLTDAGWFVPQACAEADRARTPLQAAADLHMVAVGLDEQAVPAIFDNAPRDFTLGEISFVR
jgi:hypothetical protein